MASHRKDLNGSGPVGLAPRAKVASATTAATTHLKNATSSLSAEYMEALKLLNEETMSRACDLLLSDRDYKCRDGVDCESEKSNTSSTEKSDLQQLKDLYQQCDEACTIIAKEAVNLPSMPLLHGHHHHHQPVQRPGMVPSARASVTSKPPAPKNIIPNRRMATMARIPPGKTKSGFVGMMGAAGNGKRVERQKSMPDMSQQVAEFANKRQRTGSIVQQQQQQQQQQTTAGKTTDESKSNTTSTTPPPAAMQFLAKLNQDNAAAAAAAAATAAVVSTQSSKGTNSPGKQRQSTNDPPPSSSSSSSSSQDLPSPKPPTRSQPSRASRNRS